MKRLIILFIKKIVILFKLAEGYVDVIKFYSFGHNSFISMPKGLLGVGNIRIGNNVKILPGSRLCVYDSDDKKDVIIDIEDGCYVAFDFSVLAVEPIKIGRNTLIASNVLITSEGHSYNPEYEIPYKDQELVSSKVNIGENCWIGEKVTVLAGVSIGNGCVIGANSVVTKDIPNYSVAVGIPAKVIKSYNFEKHSWEEIK